MDHKTYLRIADINIRVNSHTRHQLNDKLDWRYQNFVLKRPPRKIDLDLDLRLRDKYTRYRPVVLFETKREKINLGAENLPSGMENPIKKDPNHKIEKQKADYLGEESGWRISKYRGRFLIEGGSSGNFQAFFDKDFKRIDIFLINPSGQWKLSDVFTGFLQLFMIYYLAARRDGLVIHSAAIKDKQKDGRGYLFAGISGAGKTTTSRIWNEHAGNIKVLNDDRIIIRKQNNRFYLYGTPWHGDFSDYLKGPLEHARLDRLFFIYHRNKNKAEKAIPRELFNLFFQSLFSPFWNREGLEFTSGFLMDLIFNVPCYKFGFKNDKKIIDYVRKI